MYVGKGVNDTTKLAASSIYLFVQGNGQNGCRTFRPRHSGPSVQVPAFRPRRSGPGVQAPAFRPYFLWEPIENKRKLNFLNLPRKPVSQTLKYEAVLSYNGSNSSYYYILLQVQEEFLEDKKSPEYDMHGMSRTFSLGLSFARHFVSP
jgi:hypothetical protein